MQSVFDQGPHPSPPRSFNMADYVLSAGAATPDKPVLEIIGDNAQSYSYAELRALVASTATGLLKSGLIAGDRVLMRIGNRFEFPLCYLACIWAGLIPVPTSAQLTAPEVQKLADQCKPKIAVVERGVPLPDTISQIDIDALAAFQFLPPAPPAMGDPNRLAYIIFTSGTSGAPRGVCHAHRAIWARQMMFRDWYDLRPDDRVLHAGAFNWTYTLGTGLMDPWTMGATALIPSDGTAPDAVPGLIRNAHATIFAAAPGVYRKLLTQLDAPFPKLRHGLSAGEHLSETIRTDWAAKTGTELHQALGMSECSTFISSSPRHPAPPNSSGRPQTGRKIAILQDGAPVPFNTQGALAVSIADPGLMIGYLNAPNLTEEWFETGDMASMAEDGTITYLGRSDDMINAGGFRVSPLEVEASFASLPGVVSCAAVQVPLKKDVQVIALFHCGEADEQSLRAHAEQNLARYKQPRLYIQQSTLPYGANGKLNRRALRASFEAS